MMQSAKQPQGLISVLFDSAAEYGDRHDAAMDLGDYDESEAKEALVKVLLDREEDPGLVDAAAESLGDIWRRKGTFDSTLVKEMHPVARAYFKSWP